MIFQFLIPLLIRLVVGVSLMALGYLLMPKQKVPKPEIRDLENPTADAGRPIPRLFGTKEIKGLNVLWYGDKGSDQYTVKV